jgi:hypothetical protein
MLVNERNTPLQYVILEITSQNKLSIIKGDFFYMFSALWIRLFGETVKTKDLELDKHEFDSHPLQLHSCVDFDHMI